MKKRNDGGLQGVTMEDVARLAGVSAITVSRVLSAPHKVAPETRKRVEVAVAKLGYVPNLVAGALASRRSRLVAAIVPTMRNSVFANTIQGLSDTLRPKGYHLMLGYAGYSEAAEADLLMAFAGRQPDGIVLTGVEHDTRVRAFLRDSRLPTVEIWDNVKDPIDQAVGFDNEMVGRAVAAHLLARGCRNPAVLAHDPDGEHRSRKRVDGFRRGFQDAGIADVRDQFVGDGLNPAEAVAGFRALMKRHPRTDAVFCVNDMLAVATLMEARRMDIPVPEQVKIVGFGDFDIAAHLTPRLTTVRIPGYEIGKTAATCILDRIEGKRVRRRTIDLGFEIIVRETT